MEIINDKNLVLVLILLAISLSSWSSELYTSQAINYPVLHGHEILFRQFSLHLTKLLLARHVTRHLLHVLSAITHLRFQDKYVQYHII